MKKEQVQDLLRVLIHDVTNPLLAAQAQLELFQKRKDKDSEKNKTLIRCHSGFIHPSERVTL